MPDYKIFREGSSSQKAMDALVKAGENGLTIEELSEISGLSHSSIASTYCVRIREVFGKRAVLKSKGRYRFFKNMVLDNRKNKNQEPSFSNSFQVKNPSKPLGSLEGIELIIGQENMHILKKIPDEVLPGVKALCQEAVKGLNAQQGLMSLIAIYK